jgi:hypothetical protein
MQDAEWYDVAAHGHSASAFRIDMLHAACCYEDSFLAPGPWPLSPGPCYDSRTVGGSIFIVSGRHRRRGDMVDALS